MIACESSTITRAPCHCDSCCHWSGGLYVYRLPIVGTPLGTDILKTYQFSSVSTKWFCPGCGSHIYGQTATGWAVNPGLLDVKELQPAIEVVGHEFVEDTGDGGFTTWLPKWGGKELPLWKGEEHKSEQVPPGSLGTKHSQDEDEKLWAGCHCGGVSFCVTRPNEASRQPRKAPFPESMRPRDFDNPGGETWWLRAGETKYMAALCTCVSCMKATGFDIQAWAFVPECNVFQPDGRPLDYGAGTLKKLYSPTVEGVFRCFCGTCGATVFWNADWRDGVIDISVGLFKAKGVRAEDWLDWEKRVSYVQDSVNQPLLRELGAQFTTTLWPSSLT